jgi:hypothetical protein
MLKAHRTLNVEITDIVNTEFNPNSSHSVSLETSYELAVKDPEGTEVDAVPSISMFWSALTDVFAASFSKSGMSSSEIRKVLEPAFDRLLELADEVDGDPVTAYLQTGASSEALH